MKIIFLKSNINKWPKSDYDLMYLNRYEDNEIRYEKNPINQLGDDIEYKLNFD